MNNWKNRFIYVGLVLLIWVIQNAHLLTAYAKYNTDDSEFTSFIYKGNIRFAQDNTSYGTVLRHGADNPNIFRSDNLVYENSDKTFGDAHLVILIAGYVYKWIDNLDITVLVLSFLSISLSVLLLIRISKLTFETHTWLLVFFASVLILLTGLDDYSGIFRALDNFQNNHFDASFGRHLGYANRFPYSQITLPFFLFWVYRLLVFFKNTNLKTSLLLGVSLAVLQYTYFYYWSFGIIVTFGLLFLILKKVKFGGITIVTFLILTLPFWINFIQFNQTAFSAEYIERIKGLEFYPSLYIHVMGILFSIYAYRNQKITPSIFSICSIIASQLLINYLVDNIQPFHGLYWTGRVLFFLIILSNVYWLKTKAKLKPFDGFLLLTYWGIFTLLNLKFLLQINIQPFHWTYSVFHVVLGLFIAGVGYQQIQFKKVILSVTIMIAGVALYNSICFGSSSGKYWNFNAEEKAVMNVIKEQDNPVIIGNNYPFLISVSAHEKCYLYMGTSNNKLSDYEESHYRFIHNFKAMGYAKSNIIKEYDKHQFCSKYQRAYEENNDSLHTTWPNNTLLTAEALHHYFLKPELMRDSLLNAFQVFPTQKYSFKKDLVVIYKPTFLGNYDVFNSAPLLDSKNFRIYTAN